METIKKQADATAPTQPQGVHLPIPIVIDHRPYKAPKTPMTGTELRALAHPPIGSDRDLFEEVPGPADDIKVGDNQEIDLRPGLQFYSAPTSINPGEVHVAA